MAGSSKKAPRSSNRSGGNVSVLVQDIRYALRALRRAPGFTLVALVTLTLGIGGTTAIFSVVDAVVLRELPYPNADRLVALTRLADRHQRSSFSAADYLDITRETRSFSALAGYREDIVDLTGTGDPERLDAVEVTSGFFDVLSAPAIVGRTFSTEIDPPGGPRVAVISEGLWRRRFGSRIDVAGSTIRLNGEPATVLGVVPAWFRHPRAADVWMLSPLAVPTSPIAVEGDLLADRDVHYFPAIARLAAGVTQEQANADLAAIAERQARAFRDTNANQRLGTRLLRDELVGATRTPMLMLLGAVAVVLLIACANVASLLLARGASRRRELAVRAAIGASRSRLVRQLLTESVVLAAGGGVLGVLMAVWLVGVLTSLAPDNIPRLDEVRLDPRVALFAAACALSVGLTFGLAPALTASSPSLGVDLKDGGRSSTSARTRTRNLLVVSELAMALVLLIGAGLLLTSFLRLRAVDPGFRTTNLVTAGVPVPLARYDDAGQRRFYQALHERLRGVPMTAQSAIIFPLPLSGMTSSASYTVVGRDRRTQTEEAVAELNTASPGYFPAVGIPLLQGRDFEDTDHHDAPPVVIVNRTLAEREWPGRDPIGEHIVLGGSPDDQKNWIRVVGVAADARRAAMDTAPRPSAYMPYQQFTLPYMGVVVRTEAGLGAVSTAIRSAVHAIDRDLPVGDTSTVQQMIEHSTGDSRFRAFLVASFALVALALATVGIYGLISYTVNERVPEIGIRLALGASPAQVGRLVVGQGLKLALAGVAIGAVGALAATRLLGTMLFGVSASEPLIYIALTSILLTIAAVASWLPARRAMRVDPMVALRAE